MQTNIKTSLGQKGEKIASDYLLAHNFIIIQKNFHSAYGEIDLIALSENTLVFFEVKLRSSNYEAALSSVSYAKQVKIIKTAACFLAQFPQYQNFFTRFDVIAIINKDNKLNIFHLKNAFS